MIILVSKVKFWSGKECTTVAWNQGGVFSLSEAAVSSTSATPTTE